MELRSLVEKLSAALTKHSQQVALTDDTEWARLEALQHDIELHKQCLDQLCGEQRQHVYDYYEELLSGFEGTS